MAGVVGWDHGSSAVAGDELPSVVGLEVVVVFAQRVEVVDASAVRFGPAELVVVLEALGAGAAFSGAHRCLPPQGDLLGDRGGAAEVGDVAEP